MRPDGPDFSTAFHLSILLPYIDVGPGRLFTIARRTYDTIPVLRLVSEVRYDLYDRDNGNPEEVDANAMETDNLTIIIDREI